MRRRSSWRSVCCALLVWLPAALPATGRDGELPERVFRDLHGEPLPFQTVADVEAFLRTATVVSQREIGVGVTRPKQLVLERAGLSVRAAFNFVNLQEERKRMADGTFEMYFLDSYRADIAAYKLSLLLGLDMVPPSVERRIDDQMGVIRLWIEGLESYRDWLAAGNSGFPASTRLQHQLWDQNTFDLLIRNTDRNQTNIHWDREGDLWMIDQTRSLARDPGLIEKERKKFRGCSRELHRALKELDSKVVKRELGPFLGTFEIKALLKRRDKLLDFIESRIEERGEDQVLFNYGDPPRGVVVQYDDGG